MSDMMSLDEYRKMLSDNLDEVGGHHSPTDPSSGLVVEWENKAIASYFDEDKTGLTFLFSTDGKRTAHLSLSMQASIQLMLMIEKRLHEISGVTP